jgi:hypothetical protein
MHAMTRTLERLSDRRLSVLVPKAAADAGCVTDPLHLLQPVLLLRRGRVLPLLPDVSCLLELRRAVHQLLQQRDLLVDVPPR